MNWLKNVYAHIYTNKEKIRKYGHRWVDSLHAENELTKEKNVKRCRVFDLVFNRIHLTKLKVTLERREYIFAKP